MERIANIVLYGLIGYFLSSAGVTMDDYQFWAVMVCIICIQLMVTVLE